MNLIKLSNYFAILAFGLLGVVGLIGVLFCGAYWHAYTVIICVIIVWVSIWDNKREDRMNNKIK